MNPLKVIGKGFVAIGKTVAKPVILLKDAHKVNGYINNIQKEQEMQPVKSIFASKTFWLNVVGVGLTVSGYLPPKYGVPIMGVLNIANRFLTSGSVNLLGS